jgi:hypothetical protein
MPFTLSSKSKSKSKSKGKGKGKGEGQWEISAAAPLSELHPAGSGMPKRVRIANQAGMTNIRTRMKPLP